ncbi:MAG: hypothetical protein HY222_00560 [Thaumarchaeota archaeon]|nr:hypothetical protein [Nitrososphaerota archaeon]MBI3640878.1 hypothetical protein [Nitrososphaerota archaeon]
MTKINNKNKIHVVLFSIIIASMLVMGTIGPVSQNVYATVLRDSPTKITDAYVESVLPSEISASDLASVKQIALNNHEVKNAINGKQYQFMGSDYVGNVYSSPIVWYPEIHINVANTTELTAVINLQTNAVTTIQAAPMPKLNGIASNEGGSHHGFADDYISTSSTIDGLSMVAPSVPHSTSTSASTQEDFLLNAIESGAVDNNACSPAYYASSYFAQIGYTFLTGGGIVNAGFPLWTDTGYSCIPQLPSVAYTVGHSWFFKIYVAPGGNWVFYGIDQQNGQTFSASRSGINSGVMKTSDKNTSVFFENHNTSTSWYTQFTSGSYPSANSVQYHDKVLNAWKYWAGHTTVDTKTTPPGTCTTTSDYADTVISGSILSGGTATWNMQTMANSYPAC